MGRATAGTSPVAGIVLAAGSSVRMGRNKLLLEIGGETVLRRAVRCALDAGLSPVLVVLGPEPERAAAELSGLGATAIVNPDHALGQHVSLRRGIEAVPAAAEAVLVLLADMPFVTPEMASELARRYRDARPRLVVSRYGAATAPPTLYDRSLFPDFTGDACGRDVVKLHWEEALVLDWPPDSLLDLDDEGDYRRALGRLGGPA